MHLIRKFAPVTIALVLLTALALTACAPPPAKHDTAADEKAMRDGTDAWAKAYNSGDVETIVAMYTEDAIMMPPDMPPAAGRAAMREFMTADIAGAKAAGVTLVLLDSSEGVSGDLGWHSGTFKVTDASGASAGTGKFCETWRRGADGKWLILRDIWNNDAPAAAAAPAEAAPAPEAATGS